MRIVPARSGKRVSSMANTYTRQWGSAHPGCLIFLLDQSGSMSEQFGQGQAGGGRRKCDMVATILNNFLNELVITNTIPRPDGTSDVRPRADISVIGYEGPNIGSALGGALAERDFVSLPELQMNPADIEMRKQKNVDDTGREYEVDVPFPVWVRPKAGGGTPMCAALRRARDLAEQWAITHPNSYPPVVINVSDGASTDGDTLHLAYELRSISTGDGNTLLFNVHLTEAKIEPVMFPASEAELPSDRLARQLFEMSSIIPETSRDLLHLVKPNGVPLNARGLIINGDAASLRHMFTFATQPATVPFDPNR